MMESVFEWTCLFVTGCVAGKNAGWCVGTRIFHPSGIIVRREFSGEFQQDL